MIISVTNSICFAQYQLSPTLNANPTLFVIPCKFFWGAGGLGIIDLQLLQLLSLMKWFYVQIWIIHDNISSKVVDKRREGFGQWMNLSIIHDNICSFIHKKCHPKSYHSDIKYHIILSIIVSFNSFLLYCFLSFSMSQDCLLRFHINKKTLKEYIYVSNNSRLLM